jgi:HEAT repeat protein
MMKILIILLLASMGTPVFSEDLEAYKDVSDKFFYEQTRKLISGSTLEKITAIEKLKNLKNRRALRPLVTVLRGISENGGEPTKAFVLPTDPNADDVFMNVDLQEHNAPIIKFLAAQAIAELSHEGGMKPMVEVATKMIEKIDENAKTVSYTNSFEEVNPVNAASEILRSVGVLVDNLENLEEAADAEIKPNAEAIKAGLEVLKVAIAHKHYYIRSGAADGLRNTHRKEALEILNTALGTEKNDYVRASILGAIIALQPHNSKRLMELVNLLRHQDSTVRFRASDCLGYAGVAIAEPYLKQALQYEANGAVREQMRSDIVRVTHYRTPSAPTTALYKDGNSARNDVPSPIKK